METRELRDATADPFIENDSRKMADPTNSDGFGFKRFDRDYWMRVLQTSYILYIFMAMGILESVLGPAMLDLADLFRTTVQVLSSTTICCSVGAMVGTLAFGWLLDRFPQHRASLFFLIVFLMGFPVTIQTLIPNIYALYVFRFITGVGTGGIVNVDNVACLIIWRGREDGGVFMNGIHFGYSLGTVIGPLMSAPFLTNSTEADISNHTVAVKNATENNEQSQESGIVYLYVLVGCIVMSTGLAYLVMGIQACMKSKEGNAHLNEVIANDNIQEMTMMVVIFIILMCLFYVLCAGAEVVTGTYIATFAVKSKLGTSMVDGAYVTAIYWGSFAAFRFIAIFLSIYLNALTTMLISLGFCIASSLGLAIFAESSLLTLQVLIALMGFGIAAIYPTGLVWMENYIVVTNKIGAAYSFSAMAGLVIFPFLAGTFIVQYPMSLMYLVLSITVGCVVIFGMAAFIGKRIKNA